MKYFFSAIFLTSLLACNSLGTRDQQYTAKYKDRTLSILLKKDGSCFIPEIGFLSVTTMQCTYKIDGSRIDFMKSNGTGTWGTIDQDCISFNDAKYCIDRSAHF